MSRTRIHWSWPVGEAEARLRRAVCVGLPQRWADGIVASWRRGDDVHALRRSVSSIKAAITATYDEVLTHAIQAADACRRIMAFGIKSGALLMAHAKARLHGVPVESLPYDDEMTYRRMQHHLWWSSQIRRAHSQTMEAGAVRLGLVHRFAGGDCYASRETVERRRQQRRRNADMLAAHDVVNEEGEVINLAEIAEHSLSNAAIRRGELMTRLRGFEEVGDGLGHVSLFVTLTCPSRFHRFSGKVDNPKFKGATPKEAQAYLQGVWSRIQSKLARDEIATYGFRVAEPHHDGCPHWHFVLWSVSREMRVRLRSVFYSYGLKDEPDEAGARKHRVKLVNIRKVPGCSAVAYVAKYIAKNIDGFGIETDLLGNPAIVASERIEAWASTWRIRQFQQIGGPPVGHWRELRKIEEGAVLTGALLDAHQFVNRTESERADFAGFVRVMGGPVAKRADRPIALVKRERYRPTRYGDRFVSSVVGLCNVGGPTVETRPHTWRIVRRQSSCGELGLVSITLRDRPDRTDWDPVIQTIFKEVKDGTLQREGIVFGSGGESAPIHRAGGGAMRDSSWAGDAGASLLSG